MPLQTHRSLRAAFQKVYAAVRRTSPASVAASGAQLPSAMALSCTHRSASSRVGRAPPVVASVHHSSIALVRWALGAAYRGHCRYTCMVVSDMPAHAAQCSRPSGPTLPYALARPPFVRACACQRAIAGAGGRCGLLPFQVPRTSATCGAPQVSAQHVTAHFVSAVLITQDAAVVRGHLLLRVLFGGQRLHRGRTALSTSGHQRCSSPPLLSIRCRRRLYRVNNGLARPTPGRAFGAQRPRSFPSVLGHASTAARPLSAPREARGAREWGMEQTSAGIYPSTTDWK
jgi:hypothetical protein